MLREPALQAPLREHGDHVVTSAIIAPVLSCTASRVALHTVGVSQNDALPAQPKANSIRGDILPFVDRVAAGKYRFKKTAFLNEYSIPLSLVFSGTTGSGPVTLVFDKQSGGGASEIYVWAYDAAGAAYDLVQGEGFFLTITVRDS